MFKTAAGNAVLLDAARMAWACFCYYRAPVTAQDLADGMHPRGSWLRDFFHALRMGWMVVGFWREDRREAR